MNHHVILVGGGYGAFVFEGTDEEAEDMRRHKARWEGAIALRRPADPIEVEKADISNCWNHPGFKNKGRYVCACAKCCADSEPAVEEAQ